MNTYKHTQRSPLIITVMLIMSLAFTILALAVCRPLLGIVPILLLCGWLFHALTIEIANGELRWRFGPGLIHKSVLLGEIASAELVRTNTLEGWGIHLSRYGWLYNISGYDAVAITLKNGKRFALGTDEPSVLAALLNQPPQ